MIYTNGQLIKLKEKDICLEIIDSEIILNTEIYYTNDGSCYPLNYIEKSVDVEQYLKSTIDYLVPQIISVVKEEFNKKKKEGVNIDFWINERKKLDEEKKLKELQEKQIKKEKWNRFFNKLKKFFLLK